MFMSIGNLINLIIENWEISLTVFAVFASLCLGVFKGAKHGIRAIIVLLTVEILAFSGFAIYYFVNENLLGLIKFAIAWLPTIIFLIIVVLSTLTGMRRGLRKSLILLLHSVILALICLGLFFFCVTSPLVDKWLVDLINVFMGEGGLQNELGVSTELETLREVLLALVDGYAVEWGEIGILLSANSAYVLTIINMAYRIVFAIIFFILYELLLFIMYIIYLIFYPERRYKKKKNLRFANGNADSSYKKRPVGGGCVGMVRGLISGLISISFIGSIFFIAAGGTGASKLPEDISFGEEADSYISIYRSVEDYGDQGIFKVLNAISDPEDTPYYLFAADIVFSGGLDDELHDVSGNIKFRQEIGAYTGFAKNTLALLLKYDTDGEIAAILRGEGGDDAMDKILNVCLKPEFKTEFDNLIDNFDTQTYIINFALSLADAVIANIDDMEFMSSVSADNKELLQVLFKRKYTCSFIPGDDEDPPHFTINHLFTKKDAQIVLDVVLSVVAGDIDMGQPASLVRVLMPYIENLSIFSTERSGEMDPVLGRLYCYFENKYLTEEGETGIHYQDIKKESVQWTKEIKSLLSVSDGLITMYDKVQGGENVITTVTSLFDEDNEDYAENVKTYEEITEVVSDSKLLGRVLNSNKIRNFLQEQLLAVSENVYLPENIVYENTYDEEGNVISHGESYQLLRGLRLLANKENKEIVDTLLNSSEESTFEDLLNKLSKTLTAPDPAAPSNSLSTYFTDSVLLRSALSSVITDKAGDMLVVPKLSLETDKDNNPVNIINKAELRQIFEALPEVVDLITPLASEEITAEIVNDILEDKTFNSLLDSGNKIVEGTIAKAMVNVLENNDTVTVPQRLLNDENWEEWITVVGASGEPRKGETRKFVYTIKTLNLKVGELMDGEINSTEIYEKLKTLKREEIEELLDSGIFHYTASEMMTDNKFNFDFTVIVPSSSYVTDSYSDRVIRRDELAKVFEELNNFGLTEDMNSDSIVRTLVEKKEIVVNSNIISASVVNYILTHENVSDALSIPMSYRLAGTAQKLEEYDSRNIWHGELPNMIDAIDEIFGIGQMPPDEEFAFNSDAISDKTNGLLKTLNEQSTVNPSLSRLELCCESAIIRNSITEELDKTLTDNVIDKSVRDSAKEDGYYTKEELTALSETADIFGLEILNIDENNLAEKVKGQILTINKPREEDGRIPLDIMYPSKIVRYFITRELDKALNGEDDTDESLIDVKVRDGFKTNSEIRVYPKKEISALVDALNTLGIDDIDNVNSDRFNSLSEYKNNIDTICESGIVTGIVTKQIDNALGEDLIEKTVKEQIKGNSPAYSKQEISALVDALDELGLDDFNQCENIEVNDIQGQSVSSPEKTKLDVVYESDILVGAITKKIKDACEENSNLYYHSSANRVNLPVIKHKELDALLNILGDNDINSFDVNTVSLSNVRNQLWNDKLHEGRLPDKDSAPDSYLISVNVTKSLLKNDELYVPSGIFKDDLINVVEQLSFISALEALQTGENLNDLQVVEHMKLPAEETRATILESEIMRATFSHHVFVTNTDLKIVFLKTNIDVTLSRMIDNNGQTVKAEKLPVICNDQLNALFKVLTIRKEEELKIPSFNIESISKLNDEQLNALCEFDVTRFNLSEILSALGHVGDDTEFYEIKISGDLAEANFETDNILSAEAIKEIINQLRNTNFTYENHAKIDNIRYIDFRNNLLSYINLR